MRFDIFEISRIKHKQDVVRQACVQASDFLAGQVRTGGIVRVGDHDDARILCDATQHRVDIRPEVPVRCSNRVGAVGEGVVGDFLVAIGGVDQLVPGGEIDACGSRQQIVRAETADDTVRVQAEVPGDGVRNRRRRSFRISLDALHGLDAGGQSSRARTVSALVGRNVDFNLRRLVALFGDDHVRANSKHPGMWCDCCHYLVCSSFL